MQSFNELEISEPLKRAIQELGFETPTPIQALTLPILLGEPTDFLGLASTGTGKTAAFGIPLLERIDPALRAIQVVILVPTRELALQVAGQIDLMGKHKGIRALPIYGGTGYGDQIYGLKTGATVLVATPGRLVDHMNKGTVKLQKLRTLVLDEADEMVSMGFKEELDMILSQAPRDTSNTWLFSATMGTEIRKIANQYLRDPKQVQVNRTEILPASIEQLYYITHEANKADVLCKLIDSVDGFYGLIFCQTKVLVAEVTQHLKDRGHDVDCLHGDMDQRARERTMNAFRDRKVQMLVCTDVASRGLDVKDITHVVNHSIPRELENYIHRVGRTARSGKKGIAMSLVTPSHRSLIYRIEKITRSKMTEGKIPTRKDVGTKKVTALLAKFQEQAAFARAVELLGPEWKEAIAQMSPDEITGRFLSLMFPELFAAAPSHSAPKREGSAQERNQFAGARAGHRPYSSNQPHGPREQQGPREFDDNRRGPPHHARDYHPGRQLGQRPQRPWVRRDHSPKKPTPAHPPKTDA